MVSLPLTGGVNLDLDYGAVKVDFLFPNGVEYVTWAESDVVKDCIYGWCVSIKT